MPTALHSLLVSYDDEDYVVACFRSMPYLVERFFSVLEQIFLGNQAEKQAAANALHLIIRERLLIMNSVPKSAYRPKPDGKYANARVRSELATLVHRLSEVFVRNVVNVSPQSLTWKKPIMHLAQEMSDMAQHVDVVFPWWTNVARQVTAYRSFLWTVILTVNTLVMICVTVILIAVPAISPKRTTGIIIGCVAAALLIICSVLQTVEHFTITKALAVLQRRLFVQKLIMMQASNTPAYFGSAQQQQLTMESSIPSPSIQTQAHQMSSIGFMNATLAGEDGPLGAAGDSNNNNNNSGSNFNGNNNNNNVSSNGDMNGAGLLYARNDEEASKPNIITVRSRADLSAYLENPDGIRGGNARHGNRNSNASVSMNSFTRKDSPFRFLAPAIGNSSRKHNTMEEASKYAELIAFDSAIGLFAAANGHGGTYGGNSNTNNRNNGSAGGTANGNATNSNGSRQNLSRAPQQQQQQQQQQQRAINMRRGYFTVPYGGDHGYIEGRFIDTQVVMIAFDVNYRITRWNNAAEMMTGFLEQECVSKPLSELVTSASGDISKDIAASQDSKALQGFKIKLRAFATAPVALFTIVAPIVNSNGDIVGWNLICANSKDNLKESRVYVHNYVMCEMRFCLAALLDTGTPDQHDSRNIRALCRFAESALDDKTELVARAMVTDWEWTTVEQMLSRALGPSLDAHTVVVDPSCPPTMCISPLTSNILSTAFKFATGKRTITLRMRCLTTGVYSFSVSLSTSKSAKPWDFTRLRNSIRSGLTDVCGLLIYISERHIKLHFPCQVAAVLPEDVERTNGQPSVAKSNPSVNCTVNVVTLVSNLVDQHNISMLLLKTMFVSLTNVRDREDLETKLLAEPCDIDVIICDRSWLSESRDLLENKEHGAIVIPLTSNENVAQSMSDGFEYHIAIPLVGNELQTVMTHVGGLVAAKKSAINARAEQERILTLRQDSPWTQGKLLGRGSYGAVYEATSDLTGGKMAVKMFYFSTDSSDAIITQLLNEIKIMCSLDHANIVHYLHCERKQNRVNLFMELCNASLADMIVERKSLPLGLSTAEIIRQVVVAIAYLHSQGITHRDVKPQNILLKGNVVKLTDFGTALQGEAVKGVQGTFRYMAPEVYRGESHSCKCDIWSIGCLAAELFMCTLPFMAQNSHAMLAGMTSTDEYLDGLQCHPLVLNFLRKCLQVDPRRRPNAEELVQHPLLAAANRAEVDTLQSLVSYVDGDRNPTAIMDDSAFSFRSTMTSPSVV